MKVSVPDEVVNLARVYKVLEENNGWKYNRRARSPSEHEKRLDEMARIEYRIGEIVASIILRDDHYAHRKYLLK